MSFAGFPAAAFDFYVGLAADNSKAYWTARRDVYENSVRAPLAALLGGLAGDFGGLVSSRKQRWNLGASVMDQPVGAADQRMRGGRTAAHSGCPFVSVRFSDAMSDPYRRAASRVAGSMASSHSLARRNMVNVPSSATVPQDR